MISILVNNENLDLYEENEISFEWTSFAFSKSVKEPYSTDFTIPKTSTNIRLLGLYNLQDETPFDYQEDYIKGVLIVDEKPNITVNIQVISVSKDEISIFLVESNTLADFLSKNLVKKFAGDADGILIDTEDTIFPWYLNTQNDYPSNFIKYDYILSKYDYPSIAQTILNMGYSPTHAQYHQSKQMLGVLYNALAPFNLTCENMLTNTDQYNNIFMMATNKYVCPQNKKQIIRGSLTPNNRAYIYGGQHITNDISKNVDTEKTSFFVNRNCRIRGTITVSFYNRVHYTANQSFRLRNTDTQEEKIIISLPVKDYRAYTAQYDVNIILERGNYVFAASYPSESNSKLSFFWNAEIYDYETTKEDTEIDLEYDYRFGRPEIFEDINNKCVPLDNEDFRIVTANNKRYLEFSYNNYKKDGTVEGHHNKTVPLYFYSYFGYYCNLPEIKMKDFIYNLAWMSNSKLGFGKYNIITCMPFNVYNLKNDYEITNTQFTDEHFGKTTCFKCKNEELDEVSLNDSFTINNKWLNNEVAVKESMFARLNKGSNNMLNVPQYSEFESENGEFKSKYDEIEGVCLGVLNTTDPNNKYLEPIEYFVPSNIGVTYPHIPRLLLDSVKQIFKVYITCYNTLDLSKYDFLNIDGRLYYIISGTKNIEDGTFNIKALLVNDTEAISFNDNGELVTWQ